MTTFARNLFVFTLAGSILLPNAITSPKASSSSDHYPRVADILSNASQISAGDSHACVITATGGAKCWGTNGDGQLGDGTYITQPAPRDVIGLSSGVVMISLGTTHSCALVSGGRVKCWGSNSYGQLGDGTNTSHNIASDVSGLSSGVISISLGRYHSCALLIDGTVKCWGANWNGQLGNDTTNPSFLPVFVSNLGGAVNLSSGGEHSCVVLSDGSASCWGRNTEGQLGDGTIVTRFSPVPVSGLSSSINQITGGSYHSCGVLSSGAINCWGLNSFGQLGNGNTTSSPMPAPVAGLSQNMRKVVGGASFTCAVSAFNALKCWGKNDLGQLGNTSTNSSSYPVNVYGLTEHASEFALGGGFACAIKTNGSILCWGANGSGQLGIGVTATQPIPVNVAGLNSSPLKIYAGSDHVCVQTFSGEVKCWGNNGDGQLGDGTNQAQNMPVNVVGLSNIAQLSAGGSHTCAVTSSQSVTCWGGNYYYQLGNGTTQPRNTPGEVMGLSSGVLLVATGLNHSCALKTNGTVKCWGRNNLGQLGDGSTIDRSQPGNVTNLYGGVISIAAGGNHTCALLNSGAVYCWGENQDGELGDGTLINRLTPINVSGALTASAITAGIKHTCALTSNGDIKCWGANGNGQLGDGTDTKRPVPVSVQSLGGVASMVSAGEGHTCAALASGIIKCWGLNIDGQLGNGGTINQSLPATTLDIQGVLSLDAGGFFSCAALNSGSAKCWGNNSFGQLGDGTAWHDTPSPVIGFEEPTPTPTPTPTRTSTSTPTRTNTPTPTPTLTPTPTPALGDTHEPDDSCVSAKVVPTDGTMQQHTFHKPADEDWLRFNATIGATYIVNGIPGDTSPADLTLEIYNQCSGLPQQSQNYSFAPGVRLQFVAPSTGNVFVRLLNNSANVYGAYVDYSFSVRNIPTNAPTNAAIIVAGKRSDNDSLQRNIHNLTYQAYSMFRGNGYAANQIYYLADDRSLPGVNDLVDAEKIHLAITEWATGIVGANGALTLYLMDHGRQEALYLDGTRNQILTSHQLNTWLNDLETARPDIKINVIIDACYSGSFITNPQSISKAGRVIMTSAGPDNSSWATTSGSFFSDSLLPALNDKDSLFIAFQRASGAVRNATLDSTPFLDDNGDAQYTDADRYEAEKRGFDSPGTFGAETWPPYIAQAEALPAQNVNARLLRAEVLDDSGVSQVYAVIYPPSYVPPSSGETLVTDPSLTTLLLPPQGNDWYAQTYSGFVERGTYRVVYLARDDQNEPARPVAVQIVTGSTIFLPILTR